MFKLCPVCGNNCLEAKMQHENGTVSFLRCRNCGLFYEIGEELRFYQFGNDNQLEIEGSKNDNEEEVINSFIKEAKEKWLEKIV